MSDEIVVTELPENPVERSYTLDKRTGRLVVYLNGSWQFAESVTADENTRDSYRKMAQEV